MHRAISHAVELPETQSERWLDGLVCPECETPLSRDHEKLHCRICKTYVPLIDGTPQFVSEFPYWGEIPLEQMQEVNRRAEVGSWKSALLDFQHPSVHRASEMILNLDRANWQWLVNLPNESRVLDVGAGTGTNSHALALHYSEVIALEPVLERVRFMRQRFLQEGLSNVKTVRSSVWKLPFAPESFDLAALNGVLEWVPQGQSGNPRELQKAVLKKMHKLLRPGGYLYIGIENRTTPGYFVGYPDPHCGIPFVTVLPRPLAQWYAKRRGQNGYRNYLYSSRGYRKLLLEAGFSDVDIYLASPSYNHPRYLVQMKDNACAYYFRNFAGMGTGARAFARRLLLNTGLLKHLEYSYVILARK